MVERWTNDEKLNVVRMRLEGSTLQEIADEYGCSKQNIDRLLYSIYSIHGNKVSKNIAFPELKEWMIEHNCTVSKMARNTGINYQTLYTSLVGRNKPSIKTINAVLDYTGLTFQQAFGGNEA